MDEEIFYLPNINEVYFPLFKFLKKKYAENMLTKGEVYIPNLYSFKKGEFGGLIDDKTEGEVHIENHYDKFNGYAEDVESIMLLTMGHGNKYLENVTLGNEIKNPDALIYCTTAFLFSDSLTWAIEEGKESCIMITDSVKFFNLLYARIKHKYPYFKFGPCLYVKTEDGKYIEPNADKNSFTNKIMHDRFIEFLLKPKTFKSQREVRGVFRTSSEEMNSEISPETLYIPKIKELLIEIKFKGVDFNKLKNKEYNRIKMTNVLKSGENYSVYFETPNYLFTPLIFKQEQLYIGFSTPTNREFIGGKIIGDPPVYFSSIQKPIFSCCKLSDLAYIEYQTE